MEAADTFAEADTSAEVDSSSAEADSSFAAAASAEVSSAAGAFAEVFAVAAVLYRMICRMPIQPEAKRHTLCNGWFSATLYLLRISGRNQD